MTTPIHELIDALDDPNPRHVERARQSLIEVGDTAVEPLLESAHQVNQRLLASRWSVDKSDLNALQKRVSVLGDLKSVRALRMIAAAVADSAEGIAALESEIADAKSVMGWQGMGCRGD
jgi:hypothetical protein